MGVIMVLVVDDDPAVLKVTGAVLRRGGLGVLTATNGEQALRIIEAGDPVVDLVLSDVCMPKMPGTELVRRIRKTVPSIRVALMSGEVGPEVIEPGVPFLRKPFLPSTLIAKIRELLSDQNAAPEVRENRS